MILDKVLYSFSSTLIFFLSFIGDKSWIRFRPPKELIDIVDAKVYGHRFIIVSLGMLITIAGYLDKGHLSYPFILEPNKSHTIIVCIILFLFALWVACLFIRMSFKEDKDKTNNRLLRLANAMGIFGYLITLLTFLGINSGD